MADADRTPLQQMVADAIARSGKSRDSLDSILQKQLGTSGMPLWDIERGKSKRPGPRILRAIEEVLDFKPDELVDLVHPRKPSPRETDSPPVHTADAGETAPVLRLDLGYAMGDGTNLDTSYIESEPFEFDLGFLRSYTITPPNRLRIVDGIGDSMQPTIHDRDLLLIDLNQNELNAQDRIWAISLFGAGAVKRLQVVGRDRVLVISDNKDVPAREVSRGDIIVVGRVVGSIKRH